MAKGRKISIPKDKYVGQIEINEGNLRIPFLKKKKVALLFVCLNEHYWSYITQVVKDCKEKFLPHHKVDFFVWTDISRFPSVVESIQKRLQAFEGTPNERLKSVMDLLVEVIARFQTYPATTGIVQSMEPKGFRFRRENNAKMWIETGLPLHDEDAISKAIQFGQETINAIMSAAAAEVESFKHSCTIIETEPMEWPIPTLMRYHLFLGEEQKLNGYDYLFYLDADMKVVQKISDEILGKGLTAAPHPGYVLNKRLIPPYEPNSESTAFIPRLGFYAQEGHQKRFYPFYAAGGFQGGVTEKFVRAMKKMKSNIDKDFHKNYQAIWNDESHWNKYLWDYQTRGGNITFLDVSYIYPDSLIKDYYEKIWGRSYEPKIITLTKPFNLSPGALADLGMGSL